MYTFYQRSKWKMFIKFCFNLLDTKSTVTRHPSCSYFGLQELFQLFLPIQELFLFSPNLEF